MILPDFCSFEVSSSVLCINHHQENSAANKVSNKLKMSLEMGGMAIFRNGTVFRKIPRYH